MDGPTLVASSRPKRLPVAEIVLAVIVVSVVALMVVPLPPALLDVLLAANLAFSVLLLLVALYVPDALRIAAFPTLLLVTTLVRLSLNVSTTRLILLNGDAGHVIKAFGNFVVRGNYVVGAVIFLILTIIQFIVITKGSERVAEVGARFTLDAMPGKQMAIDAELRSGAIDGNEARRRRRALSRESQFHGAMDGAMKFVKGDTIAALLITAVNLLGGLAIGVLMKGLPVEAALKRYALLSIGDGLVSQIPSLVIATAAGVLVTRVASEESGTPLGEELASQLFGIPRALNVAGVFVLLLAIVPGLPPLPFLVIGVAFLLVARRGNAKQAAPTRKREAAAPVQRRETEAALTFVPVVVRWSVAVGSELQRHLEDGRRGAGTAGLRTALAATQEALFRELGVPLPEGQLEVDEQLAPRAVRVYLHEIPALDVELAPDLADTELAGALLDRLLPVLRARASELLGMSDVQRLLDQLEQVSPAAVRQVVPKPVSLQLLTDVLRRLVEEGVSIRDLTAILEALAQVAATERDPVSLTEFVRSQLRRQLTHQLLGGERELRVLLLEPELEDVIRGAIQRTTSGSYLALAPAAARDIVRAVGAATERAGGVAQTSIVLTQPDVRRFVRKLLETELAALRVVSFADLLPETTLTPAGRVGVADLG